MWGRFRAPSTEVVEVSKKADLEAALRAYEESHAQHRTININGATEVDERTPCQCPLCVQARAALGEEEDAEATNEPGTETGAGG